eukprot:SM000460S16112  [mRNA]  locus=s460:772:4658:- [translate_table: standard]
MFSIIHGFQNYSQQVLQAARYIGQGFMVTLDHMNRVAVTIQYPYEKLIPSERFRGRIHFEFDKCIACEVCVRVCPINLPVVDWEFQKVMKKKQLKSYSIDFGVCIFCGNCVEYCPTNCLSMTEEYELSVYDRHELNYDQVALGRLPISVSKDPMVHTIPSLTYLSKGLIETQVLIYVGAVNVLIVFAIMLVNKPEFQITLFSWTLGDVMALVICTSLFALLTTISLTTSFSLPYTKESLQDISINKEIIPKSVETIGIHLLTDFLVPFEVLSLLLLIALIGAIGIARQEAPIESKNMSISKIKDNQSIYGLITSRNMIRALMCLELIFNGVNVNLIGFSTYLDNQEIKGQVFSIFIIAIAAAEAAIGLAIVLTIYRNRILIPWLPNRGNQIVRWYALGVCLLDLLFITYVFGYHYSFQNPTLQLKDDYAWIDSIDFHWRLGIDGLSMPLVLLTGFITTLATLAAWPVTRSPKLFYFLMLAMYSGQLGLFLSQDILLFFFMWELELIPVYLLVSMWGGKRRLYAATKFILYTAGGSIFLLIGALAMGLYGSSPTFDFQALSQHSYPINLEILLYAGFLITYAVKLPAFPLHTWLPDTHGEAHYSTCMLLAGILLKMGGYGFIRINMELLPHAHAIFAPWLVIIGAAQIVYAALTSLGQRNLKRRIAYSSVSHMGFVLVGIGSFSNLGLSGAILQMVSHGLIGAGLFFLAGTSYDRTRTLLLDRMGGIASSMPKMFAMFTSCSMASLALPGMSGFVAEIMVFLGLITSQAYSPVFRFIITIIEAIGIILTPIYLLSMVRQMFYGYRKNSENPFYLVDAGPREIFVLTSLFLPMIGIGLYPDLTLSIWNKKIESLLSKSEITIFSERTIYNSSMFFSVDSKNY